MIRPLLRARSAKSIPLVWMPLTLALLALACGGGGGTGATPTAVASPGARQTPVASQSPTGGGGKVSKLSDCQRTGEKRFSAPDTIIDVNKSYVATIKTERGDIKVDLFAKDAPKTVNSFVFLACHGFFDGVTFHRVIPGFVAQGGDPTGTGSSGPGYTIPDEINPNKFVDGALGMANAGPNTNGSQFFITYGPQPNLDGRYTVFGKVIEGRDVLDKITPRDPQRTPNAPPGDKILRVDIEEK